MMRAWPFSREVTIASVIFLSLLLGQPAFAQEAELSQGRFMAAAVAAGLAAIGAGLAVGIAGAAAIGAIAEKPELLGRTLIFVGLAEGIAIYGLIIAFIVLGT